MIKTSELIEKWEPGDWPELKRLLTKLAGNYEIVDEPEKSEGGE